VTTGTVYTETVVFSPTEAFVNDVPYQLAIIEFEDGKKTTARVVGERAAIGDRVALVETRDGVSYFQKEQA
jgi:uncharacterized OB-fold protein